MRNIDIWARGCHVALPTDVGGPTPPADSGQMTAAAVVLAVLPLLAV